MIYWTRSALSPGDSGGGRPEFYHRWWPKQRGEGDAKFRLTATQRNSAVRQAKKKSKAVMNHRTPNLGRGRRKKDRKMGDRKMGESRTI